MAHISEIGILKAKQSIMKQENFIRNKAKSAELLWDINPLVWQ